MSEQASKAVGGVEGSAVGWAATPPAICSSQRGSSQLPTLLRTPTALSLHPAHRMQFPARFKLPPNCPPYGALPPSRPLQMLSGVEGSAVLGSPAGGKDGAAMGTTDGGQDRREVRLGGQLGR